MSSPAQPQPKPPKNVRVLLDDGQWVPVDTVYVGVVDGLHKWEAVRPVGMDRRAVGLSMDGLPARTSVGVQARWLE